MRKKTHTPKMATLWSEPPGMERDSRGKAVPVKQRTMDDQEKAALGKIATGVSAGHLPQRSDAVSGKAGRTPETPPEKAMVKQTRAKANRRRPSVERKG